MTKKQELQQAALQAPNELQAFAVIVVNDKGVVSMNVSGNAYEVSFMCKSLELFTHKLINGEIKNEITT